MTSRAPSTDAPLLAERLRSATQAAHASLEAALALTVAPLRRERFVAVLQGFRDFHAVWEPKVRDLLGEAELAGRDGRLALLDRDLAALGADPITPRAFDLTFMADAAAAWGSLYVMEGSTLGGRLISRALRDAPWAPQGGLTYFDPYGADTGPMWSRFRAALEAASDDLDAGAVVGGAHATFHALEAGLAPRLEAAA